MSASEPAAWTSGFTRHLAERLGGALGTTLTWQAYEQVGYIGTSDRWSVHVALRPGAAPPEGGVVPAYFVVKYRPPDGGPWEEAAIHDVAGLEAAFPTILASVTAWLPRLTVHALQTGRRYRVARAFADHYGNTFAAGEVLVFRSQDFLPYDDGHTLHFASRDMWIQGGTAIYEDFGLHVVPG